MKNPVGRPSEYDPKFCEEVDKYLATTGRGVKHMPKIESFALRLGFSKNTLYEWAKVHEEFKDALGRILLFQAERLVDDGIYGGREVNSTIVKLMLQNNHGMSDRSEEKTEGEVKISIKDYGTKYNSPTKTKKST